jgi:hypothetical protein
LELDVDIGEDAPIEALSDTFPAENEVELLEALKDALFEDAVPSDDEVHELPEASVANAPPPYLQQDALLAPADSADVGQVAGPDPQQLDEVEPGVLARGRWGAFPITEAT